MRMPELHDLLERRATGYEPSHDLFERVLDRRARRQRNQRVAAGVLGIALFALGAIGFVRLLGSEGTPASDPTSPFEGTWISTSDADGGTQTMTVGVSADGAVEIVVLDDVATVCSGTPSTMTGTGRIEAGTQLIIPAPVYTCDDGSEAETLSGPPLQEVLRDWTLFLDPETDTLSDGVGGVWLREGAEEPSPEPTFSGTIMWPQSSLQEAEEAQRLADAGDPRYTWQVLGPVSFNDPRQTEFITRFLQEELGWEEFDLSVFPGLYAGVPDDRPWEFLAVRCAPGQTNPLYPNDPEGRGCAPTIDEYRYETVYVNAGTPVRVADDPSAIWVVTRWKMLRPTDVQVTGTNYRDDNGDIFRRQVRQVVPPSDAEVSALVEAFLQARVDGEGAEEYLSPAASQVPLLYATTSGAHYERSEFELVQGPVWPGGWREFKVRLFAAGGSTVVEQPFLVERGEDGRLALVYGTLDPYEGSSGMGDVLTRENGAALAEPNEFLDGEVTFDAAWPWDWYIGGWGFTPTMTTLQFDDFDQDDAGIGQLLVIVADPLPVESGCRQGPAPADAEALARSIRSDPDLEATEPMAVTVGGIVALRMDVVAATGASVCEGGPAAQVVTPNDHDWFGVFLRHGERMRLYLLDLPEGMSARILAITISAPEPDFEHVMEAAEPIVDSIEFHAP
jgi:hypothetical protein